MDDRELYQHLTTINENLLQTLQKIDNLTKLLTTILHQEYNIQPENKPQKTTIKQKPEE